MLFKISNILATENATKTTKTTIEKTCVFGKSRYFYIFRAPREFLQSYARRFQSWRAYGTLNRFPTLFWNFDTRRNFYGVDFGRTHKKYFQKIVFFQNCLKYDLLGLEWYFWCKTILKHIKSPFSAIYHHSGHYRPLYRILNFLPKSIFERFCRFFDFSKYGRPFGRKWSKMWFGTGDSFFGSPKHFYIPYMTFHDA